MKNFLWNKLLDQLEAKIDLEDQCLVYNDLVDGYYLRESAYAAVVFATQYKITKLRRYEDIAVKLIERLLEKSTELEIGKMPEPYWNPRGTTWKVGSLPSSILTWKALTEANKLMDGRFELKHLDYSLNELISSSSVGVGSFAHDAVPSHSRKNRTPKVLNTSAMVCYVKSVQGMSNKDIINFLQSSIRSDGCFTYFSVGFSQHIFYEALEFIGGRPREYYIKLLRDRSVYFGDFIHHLGVMDFLLCSVQNSGTNEDKILNLVLRAYEFVKQQLKYTDGIISLNFTWEPELTFIRYCNFRDSSCYFVLLSVLAQLRKLDLITDEEFSKMEFGLLGYIENKLINFDVANISIDSYDANLEEINKILPRASENIVDKMYHYSRYLSYRSEI